MHASADQLNNKNVINIYSVKTIPDEKNGDMCVNIQFGFNFFIPDGMALLGYKNNQGVFRIEPNSFSVQKLVKESEWEDVVLIIGSFDKPNSRITVIKDVKESFQITFPNSILAKENKAILRLILIFENNKGKVFRIPTQKFIIGSQKK